jgi:hypothetical protein
LFLYYYYLRNINRSVGAGTIDLSERYSQQCGLGALESWEVAVISGWDRKLCNGTTIMYRSIASDGTFDWTKKVVISINDNDNADFSKLRMQREHKVIVQARILPAGQLGHETQSIVKLGLHNFGDGSSSINTSSCWFVVAEREEIHFSRYALRYCKEHATSEHGDTTRLAPSRSIHCADYACRLCLQRAVFSIARSHPK